MLSYYDYALLLAVGAVGGFLSGMLGVGGGVIFVPVIDYLLQRAGIKGEVLVNLILANSLATIAFTGTISSVKQFKMGNFFPKPILYTGLPGVITSLGLSYAISHTHYYSKEKFNLIFASLLLFLLIRMFVSRNSRDKHIEKDPSEIGTITYGFTGLFTGLVTALSGLGGGIIMIPVFNNLLKVSLKATTSISTGVITLLVMPLTVYYLIIPALTPQTNALQIGHIILPIVLPLAFGTFFMAPLGVRAAHKLPPARIRIIFAIFVVAVLTRMMVEILSHLS